MTSTRSQPRVVALADSPPDGFGPPPPPRPSRNVAGIMLGVVLVVFCAVGVAAFTASLGHRQSVLVVIRPISAGTVIQDADLGEARLARDPAVRSVAASRRREVVGQVAGVNLFPGTLLAPADLGAGPQADATHAVAGLALKAGQWPAGLRALDTVTVIAASSDSSAGAAASVVLVDSAQVTSISASGDGQTTLVSVLVPRSSAPDVASGAARGQISLVLVGHPK